MDIQLSQPLPAAGCDRLAEIAHPDLVRFEMDAHLERKFVGILYPRRDGDTAAFLAFLGRGLMESETRLYVNFEVEQDAQLAEHDAQFALASAMSRLKARACNEDGDGSLAQRMVKAAFLPSVAAFARGRADIYLSQNTFRGCRRDVASCAGLTSLWVDLDYYKAANLAHLDDDAAAIDWILDAAGLMAPTQIIRTGRGLCVRWIFGHHLPPGAAPRWRACQAALLARFKCLGADPAAQDAARVFRIVGSRNSKSGTTVRLIHTGVAIQFDDAARLLLPCDRLPKMERELVKAQTNLFERLRLRTKISGSAERPELVDKTLSSVWANGCISDIEVLSGLRRGRMDGFREKACFFSLNFQLRLGQIKTEDEFDDALRRVSGRMRDAEFSILRGKVFNLFKKRTRYRISRARLIEDLEITKDELLQLPMIGLRARRSAGIVIAKQEPKRSREKVKEDKCRAIELAKSGRSNRDIAAELDYSYRAICDWMAEARAAAHQLHSAPFA
jgi:hypothetical protein